MTSGPGLPPPIPAREAYELWAEGYDRETAISALDDRAVSTLSPPVHGRILLDAGCGTGRRLRPAARAARRAVGVDLVPAMLMADWEAGAGSVGAGSAGGSELVAGDVLALPLRADSFDLLWCRLVVGHIADLDAVYAELGRVGREGAQLVLTDFHPAATAAGHVRSFRDAGGELRTIVHHPHTVSDHRRAATAGGWAMTGVHHMAPGAGERPFYERAGRLADYDEHRQLPLVLALCLTRRG